MHDTLTDTGLTIDSFPSPTMHLTGLSQNARTFLTLQGTTTAAVGGLRLLSVSHCSELYVTKVRLPEWTSSTRGSSRACFW